MTPVNDFASVRVIVHGRVQGVFFRAFASGRARELGLTGFASNQSNGTVEVVAEGERNKLEKLIEYLKVGPLSAKVEKVDTDWSEYSGKYSGFGVLT